MARKGRVLPREGEGVDSEESESLPSEIVVYYIPSESMILVGLISIEMTVNSRSVWQ